VVDQFNWTISE